MIVQGNQRFIVKGSLIVVSIAPANVLCRQGAKKQTQETNARNKRKKDPLLWIVVFFAAKSTPTFSASGDPPRPFVLLWRQSKEEEAKCFASL
jgi:hypothetical protein